MPYVRNRNTGETKWVDDAPTSRPAFTSTPLPISPQKQAEQARASQDQAWQGENQVRAGNADARSAAAEARAQETARLARMEWLATHEPDGTPKPTRSTQPTEFQSKSAGFLGRMSGAEADYNSVPEDARDPRAWLGQQLHDWLPGVENTLPTFLGGNSPERQKSDQAARDFISASLRQESGAAIGPSEFDNQYQIFFPQPGDGAPVLKQKAQARQRALDGFKVAAGPLASQLPPRYQKGQDPIAFGRQALEHQLRGASPQIRADAIRRFNSDPRITRQAPRQDAGVDALLKKYGVK